MIRKRVILLALVAASLGISGVSQAMAQAYPSRPITIVVPYSAGGPTDTIARIMAEGMRASLGQTIIVENTTGAAGTIGVGRVARAAPDGYTIGIGHWGTHVVNAAIYPLQYDVLNDFEPVSMIATNPQLIVAKKSVPANNLQELIAWLKANSATATQGTAGHGSASHVSGVYLQNVTGARFQFVPYRGAGPAMQDLVAGQIDIMVDQAANSLPQVRSGTVKAFAVTDKTRLAAAPTFRRWTRPACRNSTFRSGMRSGCPRARQKTSSPSSMPQSSLPWPMRGCASGLPTWARNPPFEQQTPQALAAYHKAETEKWWPIIKAANIKAE